MKRSRLHIRFVLLAWLAIMLPCPPTAAVDRITCASTTSTQNSGLFDVLLPAFKKTTGIEVAAGTGQATELARRPAPQLSGGEAQKVTLARIMIFDPGSAAAGRAHGQPGPPQYP